MDSPQPVTDTSPALVWLPVDHRLLGEDGHQMPYVVLGDKYARAIKACAQCQPVLFPLADPAQIADLLALGHAPDGLVEAFAIDGARTFAYAVQWHPEWRCHENRFYAAIFAAFGAACRARRQTRAAHSVPG